MNLYEILDQLPDVPDLKERDPFFYTVRHRPEYADAMTELLREELTKAIATEDPLEVLAYVLQVYSLGMSTILSGIAQHGLPDDLEYLVELKH